MYQSKDIQPGYNGTQTLQALFATNLLSQMSEIYNQDMMRPQGSPGLSGIKSGLNSHLSRGTDLTQQIEYALNWTDSYLDAVNQNKLNQEQRNELIRGIQETDLLTTLYGLYIQSARADFRSRSEATENKNIGLSKPVEKEVTRVVNGLRESQVRTINHYSSHGTYADTLKNLLEGGEGAHVAQIPVPILYKIIHNYTTEDKANLEESLRNESNPLTAFLTRDEENKPIYDSEEIIKYAINIAHQRFSEKEGTTLEEVVQTYQQAFSQADTLEEIKDAIDTYLTATRKLQNEIGRSGNNSGGLLYNHGSEKLKELSDVLLREAYGPIAETIFRYIENFTDQIPEGQEGSRMNFLLERINRVASQYSEETGIEVFRPHFFGTAALAALGLYGVGIGYLRLRDGDSNYGIRELGTDIFNAGMGLRRGDLQPLMKFLTDLRNYEVQEDRYTLKSLRDERKARRDAKIAERDAKKGKTPPQQTEEDAVALSDGVALQSLETVNNEQITEEKKKKQRFWSPWLMRRKANRQKAKEKREYNRKTRKHLRNHYASIRRDQRNI